MRDVFSDRIWLLNITSINL